MLTHPTLEKLRAMRLTGMAKALEEQLNAPDTHDLDFEERPGLLVDREMTVRHNRRLHKRLKQANFHQLPVSHWHQYLGEATLADAILDRLVHNAYKIELRGESMRKTRNALTEPTT